jgi:hypothetical protein
MIIGAPGARGSVVENLKSNSSLVKIETVGDRGTQMGKDPNTTKTNTRSRLPNLRSNSFLTKTP